MLSLQRFTSGTPVRLLLVCLMARLPYCPSQRMYSHQLADAFWRLTRVPGAFDGFSGMSIQSRGDFCRQNDASRRVGTRESNLPHVASRDGGVAG